MKTTTIPKIFITLFVLTNSLLENSQSQKKLTQSAPLLTEPQKTLTDHQELILQNNQNNYPKPTESELTEMMAGLENGSNIDKGPVVLDFSNDPSKREEISGNGVKVFSGFLGFFIFWLF